MGGKSGGDPKMRVTRYYLSGHWGICQGPVDAIKAIWVGEKKAWTGNVTGNTLLSIAKEKLFGGMKKEGGVSGRLQVLMGGDEQLAPGALVSRLGRPANETPGFRGITSLFFYGGGRSFYWGTQPYLKPLWVTVQRIPARELAPLTAPIPRTEATSLELKSTVTENFDSFDNFTPGFNTSCYSISGNVLRIEDVSVNQPLTRPIPEEIYIYARVDFRLVDDGIGDAGTLGIAGILSVNPMRERLVDSSQRLVVNGQYVGSTSIDLGVWYTAESRANGSVNDVTVYRDGVQIAAFSTSRTETEATQASWTTQDGAGYSGGMTTEYRNLYLESGMVVTVAGEHDANPAHIIYECLTNTDWGMGADPSSIDIASFQTASVTLYDELFGLFLQWQAQSSIEDFVNNVLEHIKGALYPNPRTGQMTLRLLRDDLDIDNLKEITPDNAAMVNFSRKGWGETTNEIVVTWTNPATEKEETVRMQDLANVAQQGGVVSSSKNYHGIRTQSLAARVAERDLREESAPLSACEVEVNREFWDTVPYDGVKMNWPEYGLDGLVMRVMKVNYGDSSNSTINLSLMEDVFSLSPASFVAPADGEWQDPGEPPVPVETARLMPAPAYVVSQAGGNLDTLEYPGTYIVPMPDNPTDDESARYDVLEQVATPSGATEFQEATGDRPFPGTATLVDELSPAITSPGVVLENLFGVTPAVDELVMLGDSALEDDELELALITAIDAETGAPTLLRGVLDTVPQRWPAGTAVTITSRSVWRPLPREYTDTQSLTLRFLTSTSFGMLEDYEAPDYVGNATSRPTKPTRAANVKVNGIGLDAPDAPLPFGDTVVTWSHRNRLLEDQALFAWDLTSITPETGTTYTASIYDEDDTLLDSAASITGETWTYTEADELALGLTELPYTGIFDYTGTLPSPGARVNSSLRVTLETERDGEASWQYFDHNLSRAGYGYSYGQFYGGT